MRNVAAAADRSRGHGLWGLGGLVDSSDIFDVASGVSGIVFDAGFWVDEQVSALCECIPSGGDLQFGAGVRVGLGLVFTRLAFDAIGDRAFQRAGDLEFAFGRVTDFVRQRRGFVSVRASTEGDKRKRQHPCGHRSLKSFGN
jgi:hypothetical protein